jgi:C1A family cysteine protease
MQYTETAGQVLESEYPYTSGSGNSGTCQRRGTPQVYVESVAIVPSNSSEQLIAAIYQGPCSVTVAAEAPAFMGYRGGIVNTPSCGTQLDHAITGVGYGVENGQQYYIVRNSWGTGWGE